MRKFNPNEIRKLNNEDRMWFVKYWAEYVKNNPDKVWSKQQNVLINSVFKNPQRLTKEEYLKIKTRSI